MSTTSSHQKTGELGYAFHNPDAGMEWLPHHPRESGEVPDAGRCRRMTLDQFRAAYGPTETA